MKYLDALVDLLEKELERQLDDWKKRPAKSDRECKVSVEREGDLLTINVESDNDDYCSGDAVVNLRELAAAIVYNRPFDSTTQIQE
jgi:hypothetical protein